MEIINYNSAKERFLTGDYSTEDFFQQNSFFVEEGYCKLLKGELANAKKIFREYSSKDLRADWALKLTQFIEGRVHNLPSYFQIRNFLEIDLSFLISAAKPDYVENIINGADIFYSVNQESYKFIARVMLFNDFNSIALHYLSKAKEKFYYDPEMHFMLASCHIKNNDKALARKSLEECLKIMPQYLPAKRLLLTLE